jgi:hypothetical protein
MSSSENMDAKHLDVVEHTDDEGDVQEQEHGSGTYQPDLFTLRFCQQLYLLPSARHIHPDKLFLAQSTCDDYVHLYSQKQHSARHEARWERVLVGQQYT